jgi:hypothetical protein
MNVMLVAVSHRTAEIGLLKAVWIPGVADFIELDYVDVGAVG